MDMILRVSAYIIVLLLLFIVSVVIIVNKGIFSENLGPGEIFGKVNTQDFVIDKIARQEVAAMELNISNPKQILFGDFHVHSTFSADAHIASLPIAGGSSVHPVADACDFARHCSALDFWAITDHSEATNPKRWMETKEIIRQCNELNIDKNNPDCVAFLGFEWTQVGPNRGSHWGHHNVILKEEQDDMVPARAIASQSLTRDAMLQRPEWPNVLFPFLDLKNLKRYIDIGRYFKETTKVPVCEEGIPSKELPKDCHEEAINPLVLAEKVEEYESDYLIIPHGQTWGLYTPLGYTLDKSLELSKRYPEKFDLLEIYSGHGNSEEYRSWRSADVIRDGESVLDQYFSFQMGELDFEQGTFTMEVDGENAVIDIGTQSCPEPSDNYVPLCWRAGEVMYERCIAENNPQEECKRRMIETRQLVVDRGRTGHNVVPNFTNDEKGDAGQCRDCYSPAMNYVPGGSAQYGLALTKFDEDGTKHRFRYGFIGSSDNHQAAAGSGYKEIFATSVDGSGPTSEFKDKVLHMERVYLGDEYESPIWKAYSADDIPVAFDINELRLGFNVIEWARQRGFYTTGGMAAVHSEGRSKEQIWEALKRHETYATSGPRILLWFNLVNDGSSKDVTKPMGSTVTLKHDPTFEVKAMGSFKQKPGCPEDAYRALGEERVHQLCYDECYYPSDERNKITRIEVVRVLPQVYEDQPVDERIQDAWKTHYCDTTQTGCSYTFTDNEYSDLKADVSYYVRAIEEPSLQINVKGAHCADHDSAEGHAHGGCQKFKLCTQDWKNPRDFDMCASIDEPRAWSSPIYVDYSSY